MEAVEIRKYTPKDEKQLFALIEREGIEWTYWQGENRAKYKKVLADCINYVLFEDETLCGYVRCRDDAGFGIYIFDLLVDKSYRNKEYGRLLIERVCHDFPNEYVYVTTDIDLYFEKLGYDRIGSIFILQKGE